MGKEILKILRLKKKKKKKKNPSYGSLKYSL